MSIATPLRHNTHRESPTLATTSLFFFYKATTAGVPLVFHWFSNLQEIGGWLAQLRNMCVNSYENHRVF